MKIINYHFNSKHLISFVCIMIFLFLAFGSTDSDDKPKNPNAWKTEDNSIMAYIMMEGFVKRQLKSPGSAKFPGIFDGKLDHIKYLGNQNCNNIWIIISSLLAYF